MNTFSSIYAQGSPGRRAAACIVRAFETGSPVGGYDTISDAKGDRGGLSYGWFQAADGPDTLDEVVALYIDRGGMHAAALEPFLPTLEADAGAGNIVLKAALEMAAFDSVMHEAQDEVFERRYGDPAAAFAASIGLATALGYAVCLDSYVHSGRVRSDIRARFPERPPKSGGDEAAWLAGYAWARRAWLMERGGLVARTVYRMDTFDELLRRGNFALSPSFRVAVGRGWATVTAKHVAWPKG